MQELGTAIRMARHDRIFKYSIKKSGVYTQKWFHWRILDITKMGKKMRSLIVRVATSRLAYGNACVGKKEGRCL